MTLQIEKGPHGEGLQGSIDGGVATIIKVND